MRLALIGYGNIARKHIEVFRALGCEIIASSNTSEKGNALAKAEGRIPKTYSNYQEMIDREKPDGIVNCVSFDKIFEVTKTLIPLGIPLLIEKPAGTRLHELTELIDLQQQFGTIVQVALNRRHYSVIHKALEDMGGVEHLDMINLEWSENPHRVRQAKNYNDDQVSKIIFGNSIHGLDMLDFYSGGIDDFSFYTSTKQNFQWNMVVSGKSKIGIPVIFSSTWANVAPWRLIMHSKSKRYVFAPLETCSVFEDGKEGVRIIEPDLQDREFKAGFYKQASIFLEGFSHNLGSNFGLTSAVSSMRLAEGLYTRLLQ